MFKPKAVASHFKNLKIRNLGERTWFSVIVVILGTFASICAFVTAGLGKLRKIENDIKRALNR